MIEQMDCSTYRAHLDEWLDDELDDRTRAAMEAHASRCEECAALTARAREALALTRSLGAEAVVPLDAQVAWRRAVRAELGRTRRGRFGRTLRAAGSVAAALALLMGCTLGFRAAGLLDPAAAPTQAAASATESHSTVRSREFEIWQTYAARSAPTAYAYIASDGAESQPAAGDDVLAARAMPDASGALLIRSASRSILTDGFDAASQRIRELTMQYDGYVEEDTVSTGSDGLRAAELICVVPAVDADSFLQAVDHVGSVTRTTEHLEDASANVQDVTDRMGALEAERDRLSELIDEAESAEELERLKSMMRSTLSEIESLQADHSRLSSELDNVRVAIHLAETAAAPAAVTDAPTGMIGRMGSAFVQSARGLRSFARDMAVSLMFIAPYALTALAVAACVAALALLTRRFRRHPRV